MSNVADAIEAAATVELQRKLPTLQAEIERMEEAQIARVFAALEKKALSPDQAYLAWLEIYTLRSLYRRLNTRAKVGQAMVERVATGAGLAPTDGGK